MKHGNLCSIYFLNSAQRTFFLIISVNLVHSLVDNFLVLFNIGIIHVSHLHMLLQLDKSSTPNLDFGITVKSPHKPQSDRFKLLQPLFSRVTKKSVFTILFLRFTVWNNELSLDMILILLDTWPHIKMSAVSV